MGIRLLTAHHITCATLASAALLGAPHLGYTADAPPDPVHAAHTASANGPALDGQLAELRAKVQQLEVLVQQRQPTSPSQQGSGAGGGAISTPPSEPSAYTPNSSPGAMPAMGGGARPMQGGMQTPPGGGMNMMDKMDKMMGMMDKMMSMGGGAAGAGTPMAGDPSGSMATTTNTGKGAMSGGAMPAMGGGAKPMQGGMPMPPADGRNMMGKMDKMMGMMDKMMSMGGGPAGAGAPIAGGPSGPMASTSNSSIGAMPSMGGGAKPMQGGMQSPPVGGMNMASPPAGRMSMMGMMDKMMDKMDKMMSMGGGAAGAGAPMAGAPSGGMSGGGKGMGMGMMQSEMSGMGGSAMPAGAPASGMSGSGMGMGMGMMGMMGMGPGAGSAMAQSALPGFPGASHIYHIGATDFFLDHPQHITLSTEQTAALNNAKEQAMLAKTSADRAREQAEQDLWTLTASDQPDSAQIEMKIREIEKVSGDERFAFIRAIGDASMILTDEQRQILAGFAPPTSMVAPVASAAPMTPMQHM